MEEKITFSPALFSSQVNTALLRLGLSKLHNDISSSPLEQLLGGITGHSGTFCLIIRAVRGSGWWVWLLKVTTASFLFLLLLHLPFAHQGRHLSSSSLAFFWILFQNSHSYLYICGSVVLHPFGHYAFSSTTSLTLNLSFPFFVVFHVTVNFGALINPLTLVFTPFQHQQGIPMVCGRHPLTGLYSSLHVLFLLQ